MNDAGPGRFGPSRAELVTTAVVVGCALLFRLLFLGSRLVLQGDEIHYAESLFRFVHGRFLDGVSDYWSFFYPFAGIPFGLAAGDAEKGLRLLSIVSGAAAVVPATILARRFAGPRAALFAGILVALHPNLIAFSTTAATEPLFSLLLLSSFVVFIKGLDGGGAARFAGAGALLGLSYLTRPEAQFFLPLLLLAAIAARGGSASGATLARRAVRAAAVAAAFAVVSIPYFAVLREATGSWTAGSKAAVNVSSPAIWEDTLERERFVYSLNEKGDERLIEELGRESAFSVAWREKGRIAASYVPKMIAGFALVPLLLTSPALLLLVPLGLLARRRPRGRGAAEWLLIAAGAFPFVFYSIFRVELRYLLPYLPVYLVWGGIGCGILVDWIGEVAPGRRWIGMAAASLVFTSLVPFSFSKYELTRRSMQPEWREIGTWMREHGGRRRILAHSGCPVSYYAGDPEATFIPWTDAAGLLRFARFRGFGYVLIDERYIRAFRPALEDIVDTPPPGLEAAWTFEAGEGRVIVYRLGAEP